MSYLALLPALLMAVFGCATFVLEALTPASSGRRYLVWFNCFGQASIGYALVRQWLAYRTSGDIVALQGSVSVDTLALFTNAVVWLAVLALLLTSYRYLEVVAEHRGEYYGLALCAQCGMYFMATGVDLVTIFIGLELTSITSYILVGFLRSDRRSNEAALKYLILGALSSAFVLYGFSLVYGISGSTDLNALSHVPTSSFRLLANAAVLIGLLFKVSAAPFHSWALDTYDGAPTPVAGFLAVASKVAAFAVLIRFVQQGTTPEYLLAAAAVLSLTVGSVAALTQERLKRLFAYSGVAHAGYALLGVITGSMTAVFVYLFVYALMTIGTFTLLTSLRSKQFPGERVDELRGLSRKHPAHAALFAILLLSLAGIPPTAGFIGKYFIFAELIKTGHIGLAVVGSLYIAVSLYFYFRLVREMYLERDEHAVAVTPSWGVRITLGATAIATVLIGIFPQAVLSW